MQFYKRQAATTRQLQETNEDMQNKRKKKS